MTGVIFSSSLVITAASDFNADSPIVGYDNVVTDVNITATTEESGYPATNLANPATHLIWKAGAGSPSSDEYLTCITGTVEDVDYLGIAHHNFGTAQATLTVEGTDAAPGSPADWNVLAGPMLPADDGPVIFRWTAAPYYGIRLRVQESAVAGTVPFCAVMYVGKLLMLQRRLYVGHQPMKFARRLNIANHRSVSGAFLGRIVLGQKNVSGITLNNMTPDWFRASMWPFLLAAQEIPFFFAWRPTTYPLECGYCWLTGDPTPVNAQPNGMMSVSLDLEGVI
jgi:hypothetical protein